jgi:carboxyl-terminal processing protease
MRLSLLAALAAACTGLVAGSAGAGAPAYLLDEVRQTLTDRYYRPLPPGVLQQATIAATLRELDDPYTEYLSPIDLRALRRQSALGYVGIGVTVTPRGGALLVTSAPPGPARTAGVRPGDLIVGIDGTPTSRLTLPQAVDRVSGPRGTIVRLALRRGDRPLTAEVKRGAVRSQSVSAWIKRVVDERRVGVIRVFRFSEGTAAAVRQHARRFEELGLPGVVLDLRSNPGGLLDEAVGVVSAFVRDGAVLTISGAHEPRRTVRASGAPSAPSIPVVVTVNRFSASAAEVVAAALRENDRARVVGEPTFGKAVLQELAPLSDGGALQVTVARYLTPRGRDLSSGGLTPDVVAPDDPSTIENESFADAVALLLAGRD